MKPLFARSSWLALKTLARIGWFTGLFNHGSFYTDHALRPMNQVQVQFRARSPQVHDQIVGRQRHGKDMFWSTQNWRSNVLKAPQN